MNFQKGSKRQLTPQPPPLRMVPFSENHVYAFHTIWPSYLLASTISIIKKIAKWFSEMRGGGGGAKDKTFGFCVFFTFFICSQRSHQFVTLGATSLHLNPSYHGMGRPVAVQSSVFFEDSRHLGMIVPGPQRRICWSIIEQITFLPNSELCSRECSCGWCCSQLWSTPEQLRAFLFFWNDIVSLRPILKLDLRTTVLISGRQRKIWLNILRRKLYFFVVKIFWVKFFWVKIFLGEIFLGEIFLGENFFGWKFFWVKIFGWKFSRWKFLGENFGMKIVWVKKFFCEFF